MNGFSSGKKTDAEDIERCYSSVLRNSLLSVKALISIAHPHMCELATRTKQSCHLTVYVAGRVIVIAKVDSPERWVFSLKVGALLGLVDTAAGLVLLSYRSDMERNRMLLKHIKAEGEVVIDPHSYYIILKRPE